MPDDQRQRIDQLVDRCHHGEEAFNRLAEAERLGVHLRRGRIYPAAVGQTHAARMPYRQLVGEAHRYAAGALGGIVPPPAGVEAAVE